MGRWLSMGAVAEPSASCDTERINYLSLNLANEIATGRRTVEEARRMYAQQLAAMKAGRPAPYAERLFSRPRAGWMNSDVSLASM